MRILVFVTLTLLAYDVCDGLWGSAGAGSSTTDMCNGGFYRLTSGLCAPCPKGSFSFDGDDRVEDDKCYKCPIGSYQRNIAQTWCDDCEDYEYTENLGSTDPSQCKQKAAEFTKYSTVEVEAKVTVSGSFCSMREALWEVNEISPFKGRFKSCKEYKDASDGKMYTILKVSLESTPNNAYELTKILSYGRSMYTMVNAYIRLYGPMVKEMLRDMDFMGIKFNVDMLDLDIQIASFDFAQYPKDKTGGVPTGNMAVYELEMIDGPNCNTNEGKAIIKLVFSGEDSNWKNAIRMCASGTCDTMYLGCVKMTEARSSIYLAVSKASDIAAAVSIDNAKLQEIFRNNYVGISSTFKVRSAELYMKDGCEYGQGYEYDAENQDLYCKKCNAGEFFDVDTATCASCPFQSYTEKSGQPACNYCGYNKMTYWNGASDRDMCMDFDSQKYRKEIPNGGYTFDDYIRSWTGEADVSATAAFNVNMCQTARNKKSLDAICKKEFPNSLKEIPEGAGIQDYICYGSNNFANFYVAICESHSSLKSAASDSLKRLVKRDHDNEGDDHGDWEEMLINAGCSFMEPLAHLDKYETLDETCSQCTADDKIADIEMVTPRFGLESDLVEIAVSVFAGAENLKGSNPAVLRSVVKTILSRFGILDLNSFLYSKMANTLMDLGLSVPEGLTFEKVSTNYSTAAELKESFQCENNNPRVRCDNYDECWYEGRNIGIRQGSAECSVDRCNNCAATYTKNGTVLDVKDYCEFKEVDNGYIRYRRRNTARYRCNPGYYHSNGSSYVDCSSEYQDYPTCSSVGKCDFPKEIANGSLVTIDELYVRAQYSCNDGFNLQSDDKDSTSSDSWATCRAGNMSLPTCQKACEFPEFIENGKRSGANGNQAWYRCDDGYGFVRGSSMYCNNGEVSGNVSCVKCDQPDDINNGYKAEDNGDWVKYECNEGYYNEGSNWFGCNDQRDKNTFCKKRGGSECREFPERISNGYRSEYKEESGWAKYECRDGYRVKNGSNWVNCNDTRNLDNLCQRDDCREFPELIRNGYRSEYYEEKGYARYMCYDGYRVKNGSGWFDCDDKRNLTVLCQKDEDNSTCREFPSEIKNGYRDEYYKEKGMAQYKCFDGYHIHSGNGWFNCSDTRNLTELCMKNKESECREFPYKIKNGYRAEYYEEKGWARYQCLDGYHIHNGSDWVNCNDTRDLDELCHEEESAGCDDKLPESIRNGKRVEYYPEKRVAKYECYDGYYGTGRNWFSCEDTRDLNSFCKARNCTFPEFVEFGRQMSSNGMMAQYQCYDGYLMSNSRMYPDRDGVAGCKNGTAVLPYCYKSKGCAFPKYIDNGYAKNISDYSAEYVCKNGSSMIKTPAGNRGTCRKDKTMDLPKCLSKEDYWSIDFKLSERNRGYILFKLKTMNYESDYLSACDDGFSDNAAGAVCRQMGYKKGAMITPTKTMKRVPNPIGVTQINCPYDDTFMYSCDAQMYNNETEYCGDSEKVAIRCYNSEGWAVKADLKVASKKKAQKLSCYVKATKDGEEQDVAGYDVKFYKFKEDGTDVMDKDDWTELKAGKYNKKKKYFASVSKGKTMSTCNACVVWFGDKVVAVGDNGCEEKENKEDKTKGMQFG